MPMCTKNLPVFNCFTKVNTVVQPCRVRRLGRFNKHTVGLIVQNFQTLLLYMTWVSLNCTIVPHSCTPICISRASSPVNSQPAIFEFISEFVLKTDLRNKHEDSAYSFSEVSEKTVLLSGSQLSHSSFVSRGSHSITRTHNAYSCLHCIIYSSVFCKICLPSGFFYLDGSIF